MKGGSNDLQLYLSSIMFDSKLCVCHSWFHVKGVSLLKKVFQVQNYIRIVLLVIIFNLQSLRFKIEKSSITCLVASCDHVRHYFLASEASWLWWLKNQTSWLEWSLSNMDPSVPLGKLLSSSIRASTPSFWGALRRNAKICINALKHIHSVLSNGSYPH